MVSFRPAPPAGPYLTRAADQAMQQRSIVIGLLSHSATSDNFGVGALTIANLSILRKVAAEAGYQCRFRILGVGDGRPPYVADPDVDVCQVRWRQMLGRGENHLSILRGCNLVCDISGGDSFSDIYGVRRFSLQWAEKLLSIVARKPLILSPQTIGPFLRPWTRRLATLILNRCHAVVVRDHPSFEFVHAISPEARAIEATDVAFRLPYTPLRLQPDGRLRVGVNVSGLLFNGGYTRNNMFGLTADYDLLLRTLLRRFLDTANVEVHIIGHVISGAVAVEDDYRVCAALAAQFPGTVLAPRFEGPCEAKSYISAMDFFCGARMHACIAAFSSGVPTVPIAYSRKFAGLFHSLGYHMVADCRTQTTSEVADTVLAGYAERDQLRRLVAAGNANATTRLAAYEDVLREAFRAFGGGRS